MYSQRLFSYRKRNKRFIQMLIKSMWQKVRALIRRHAERTASGQGLSFVSLHKAGLSRWRPKSCFVLHAVILTSISHVQYAIKGIRKTHSIGACERIPSVYIAVPVFVQRIVVVTGDRVQGRNRSSENDVINVQISRILFKEEASLAARDPFLVEGQVYTLRGRYTFITYIS